MRVIYWTSLKFIIIIIIITIINTIIIIYHPYAEYLELHAWTNAISSVACGYSLWYT